LSVERDDDDDDDEGSRAATDMRVANQESDQDLPI
jgi:hypothetical protein